jgi:DNA-binding NarL/FixJ family response regulator
MRSVQVLVVDDYEPFRQFVCSTLGKIPGLQVVGQASDGVEAVRKAEELQPDLILMDIGLPSLSGIEAARRIRKLAPMSKILFLSQETSGDVVDEALRLGAPGYIVKAHAGSELLAAVEAVLQGEQFVGSGVADYVLSEFRGAQAPGRSKETFASIAPPLSQESRATRCHEVQFYSDDASFLAGFVRFVETALAAGNAVIDFGVTRSRAPLGRDSQNMRRGYSVRVCAKQLSARAGEPHLRENLCRTLSCLFSVNRLLITLKLAPRLPSLGEATRRRNRKRSAALESFIPDSRIDRGVTG